MPIFDDVFASSELRDNSQFLFLNDNYAKTAYVTDLKLHNIMHWTVMTLYTAICVVNNQFHFNLKSKKISNTFCHLLIYNIEIYVGSDKKND